METKFMGDNVLSSHRDNYVQTQWGTVDWLHDPLRDSIKVQLWKMEQPQAWSIDLQPKTRSIHTNMTIWVIIVVWITSPGQCRWTIDVFLTSLHTIGGPHSCEPIWWALMQREWPWWPYRLGYWYKIDLICRTSQIGKSRYYEWIKYRLCMKSVFMHGKE